ncbi:MAG: hypothetical protein IJE78_04925 [Bacteroidaceae bacterium]|nr:hypothetical protein [Bacteroidaceae bacterium]
MKRYIQSADTEPYYNNYKVIPWDRPDDVRYFVTYTEAIQYGDRKYGSRYDIEEI